MTSVSPVTEQPFAQSYSTNYGMGEARAPGGIAALRRLTELTIRQRSSLAEVLCNWDTKNKYDIYDSSQGEGRLGSSFEALEESECCDRACCGPLRPFEMAITDDSKEVLFKLQRPLKCQGCCCPCSLQHMEIVSADGRLMGSIDEEWSAWTKHWTVKDGKGQERLKIEGPCCHCKCFTEVYFPVVGAEGDNPMGMITKKWQESCLRECCTNFNTFTVSFPQDLDTDMKATLIGATFLVDYMYYQVKNQNNG